MEIKVNIVLINIIDLQQLLKVATFVQDNVRNVEVLSHKNSPYKMSFP